MVTSKLLNLALTFALTSLPLHAAYAFEYQVFAGIRFVKMEPGCFLMGRDTDIKEKNASELPQHRVCIEKPFYLGETEVTQEKWEKVMGNNPSKVKSLYRPVDRVNWNDVQAFIDRLNSQEGGHFFRLPTEAEWEYAARAGSTSLYSFGGNAKDLANYAWYGDEGYHGASHEVEKKQPNNWGLYDMHGNVWEWVQDWYDASYYQNSPDKDPKGPPNGQYKIYRGGSWVGKPVNLRSSIRYSGLPTTRTNDIGFRLLKEIP
ncbi:MAG: formylglycine-generating enzyme family protein [Methylococcales bacterium]|nr:formylglycine-generating enzyme family protein [Methylococcales bacterium]